MIDWPEALKKDLIERRVVVVLGGGVSKNSLSADGAIRPPLWREFLDAGLSRLGSKRTSHIKKALAENDLLHACEWIKDRMEEDWVAFLRSHFHTPAYRVADIHKHIFRLDQRVYMSLNFDQIFENFVIQETGGQVIVKKFYDPDVHSFLRDDQLHIIKLHGSIDQPNNLIFTQGDYARARVDYSAFYSVLDACLLSHTFLFLGCGVSDPDLALLLENQRFNFPMARPHYLVTSSKVSAELVKSLRANRNLKCVTYDAKDTHRELEQSLLELSDYLDLNRGAR